MDNTLLGVELGLFVNEFVDGFSQLEKRPRMKGIVRGVGYRDHCGVAIVEDDAGQLSTWSLCNCCGHVVKIINEE